MSRYLSLFLFFGLALGQEGINNLLIKKAEKNIKFKTGQKLILTYTNEELDVVNSTEGEYNCVGNDFLKTHLI